MTVADVLEDLRAALAAERSTARAKLVARGVSRAQIDQVMRAAEDLHHEQLAALRVVAEGLIERGEALEAGGQIH